MELLYDIVIRLVENVPGDPSAFAKCLSPLLSDNCYQALSQIKAVLEDDSLDDRECFMKIEKMCIRDRQMTARFDITARSGAG